MLARAGRGPRFRFGGSAAGRVRCERRIGPLAQTTGQSVDAAGRSELGTGSVKGALQDSDSPRPERDRGRPELGAGCEEGPG